MSSLVILRWPSYFMQISCFLLPALFFKIPQPDKYVHRCVVKKRKDHPCNFLQKDLLLAKELISKMNFWTDFNYCYPISPFVPMFTSSSCLEAICTRGRISREGSRHPLLTGTWISSRAQQREGNKPSSSFSTCGQWRLCLRNPHDPEESRGCVLNSDRAQWNCLGVINFQLQEVTAHSRSNIHSAAWQQQNHSTGKRLKWVAMLSGCLGEKVTQCYLTTCPKGVIEHRRRGPPRVPLGHC